uniref:Uncharacterized protein n=1 Tax=Nelumbo nucifera TaxID=4432 RepID=A0A822Z481_NELNU|nr:TPA_asm: hypothetical protein HUJ06_013950 [Nelumbo nucifera]
MTMYVFQHSRPTSSVAFVDSSVKLTNLDVYLFKEKPTLLLVINFLLVTSPLYFWSKQVPI